MKPPCYNEETKTDCSRRRVGCHATCPEWAEFEEWKATDMKRRRKEQAAKDGLFEHFRVIMKEKQRFKAAQRNSRRK